MKFQRTIAPVGIGAFYIERFMDEQSGEINFVVVYDCGKGITTCGPLRNIIDTELGTYDKTEDLLFLSHFDKDHIVSKTHL